MVYRLPWRRPVEVGEMAYVGIFALNMTPRTGGAFHFVDSLMTTAAHSDHHYLYLSHSPRPADRALPANVDWTGRSRSSVRATQALLNLPKVDALLRNPLASRCLVGGVTGISPRLFRCPDLWLWPHTCAPIARFGPPVVPIVHDMIHRRLPEMFGPRALAMRKAAEGSLVDCAGVLCPSHTTEADLLADYPELRGLTSVFSEAPSELADASDCTVELSVLDREFGPGPFLLSVGLDWPNKNHELLLAVANKLISRRGSAAPRIIFVGGRRSDRLQRAIKRSGLAGVALDIGPVSREMLCAFYYRSLALLFPSKYEGFGIPLVEAMHCGLPIVASDRGSIPEVVNGAGELLSADDPAQWVTVIERLLDEPAYRIALGNRARSRAANYTWKRTWSELDAVFDRLAMESTDSE
jgi:glycosyltransferase involved in cell wall biosynthesis